METQHTGNVRLVVMNLINLIHKATVNRIKEDKNVIAQKGDSYYLNAFSHYPLFNGIFDFNIEEAALTKQLNFAINLFKEQSLPFSWWWLQDREIPSHVEKILTEMKFTSAGEYSGILLELSPNRSQLKSSIEIQEVENKNSYETFINIVSETFQLADPIKTEFALMLDPFSKSFSINHYIGYLYNQPVGVLTSYIDGEAVGLYCGATLPNARKQGVATALANHALTQARTKGCKMAVAQLMAKNMAGNISENLGFKTVCRFTPYVYGFDAASLEP